MKNVKVKPPVKVKRVFYIILYIITNNIIF